MCIEWDIWKIEMKILILILFQLISSITRTSGLFGSILSEFYEQR